MLTVATSPIKIPWPLASAVISAPSALWMPPVRLTPAPTWIAPPVKPFWFWVWITLLALLLMAPVIVPAPIRLIAAPDAAFMFALPAVVVLLIVTVASALIAI